MRLNQTKSNAIVEVLLLIILISLLVFLFSACKHAPLTTNDVSELFPDTTTNNGNSQNTIPCNPDTVYFNNTILPLLVSNCAKSGCHDAITAKEGIVLDSYSNIMSTGKITPGNPNNGKIMKAITETDPDDIMPPTGNSPLTQQQINQIELWITQGAQNNYCNDCDTNNVTYNSKIKPLMDLKCKGCHSGSNPPSGINLSTYAGTVASAQTGQLAGSVKHLSPYSAMPKGGAQLPQCEIDIIDIWIQNQYPQ
ncbi:MAG: c-type cytochrome domain-containing protein [Bacteroidia bacterium]